MKHDEIQIGHVYAVKVSGRLAPVRISYRKVMKAYGTRYAMGNGPREIKKFIGVNERTGRTIGPFTAAKCRFELEMGFTNTSGERTWRRVSKPEKGILG